MFNFDGMIISALN